MKNITPFLFLLITFSFFAQSPEKMSYQAVIRDATNTLVTNQSVGMQISILQTTTTTTTTTGTAIYTETQTVTTNTNGLVSLEIGMGVTSDDFSAIDWKAGPYFIKTETDPTGGTSYTITGTSQLMSVPFAMYSKTSGDGITVEQSDAIIENTGKVSMVLGTTAKTALAGDTSIISSDQTDAIEANTAKEGYTEAAVSNNTAVAANTLKVGITAQQASDITSNTAKTVITTEQSDAIVANTAKTGITSDQATAIGDNTAKLGYTEAAVSANTAVAANTLKVGITTQQASDITSNTAKTGITSDQATAITDNTTKVGYTDALVSANTDVAANTTKVGMPEGTAIGQMNYWNGSTWLTIDVGINGSVLVLVSGVPTWSTIGLNAGSPTITSGATGNNLEENTNAGQTVYTITANDDGDTISSYAIAGTDAALLSVNASSGVVTLTADPDYENKSSYSFTVTATDAVGNTSAPTSVTFSITNVDEFAPTITSGTTGTDLVENSGAGQTVYTITADANDGGTISSYALGWELDGDYLSLDQSTGAVSLQLNPDFEDKSSYSFTVTATDEAGTSSATTVTFSIINVNDTVPSITSGAAGTDLVENSGAGQTVYTITADANDGGTISSYAIAGTDAGLLSVNSSTGAVSLIADPDYETKPNYSFTVTATDAAGISAPTTVTFSITNVGEVGDFYQGGVVFHLFEDGETGYIAGETHGLIAAVADQSSPIGIRWYNGSYGDLGITATAIGTGAGNTTAIISAQGTETSHAAGSYTVGSYTDWFLPSKDELNQMYTLKATINTTASANGGSNFSNNYYWSSTERGWQNAWFQYFGNGNQDWWSKEFTELVRAIRAF